jgi:plastocyanin
VSELRQTAREGSPSVGVYGVSCPIARPTDQLKADSTGEHDDQRGMRMTEKRFSTLIALAVAIAALALIPTVAFGGGGAQSASTHTVTLKNIAFHPGNLSIHRGDTVTWKWEDGSTEHNVTGSGFHSRTQAHGSYSVRFTHAGTFSYRCTIHAAEGMRGKIIVH